jgi:hydroxyacylglutathione hydrolase
VEELAEGVFQLRGFPPNAINVYLVEGVMVDASSRASAGRILEQLAGRDVRAHALTHAHPDHQGSSHAVCEALAIPLWCGEGDADAMELGQLDTLLPQNDATRKFMRVMGGPPHPVARRLRDGDEIGGGFVALATPGHSPGHHAFWRERDGVLIAGDVFVNMDIVSGELGLAEPPVHLTPDVAGNRRSARRLALLEPELVCFGHGPPLRDPGLLREFVEALPREAESAAS